MTGNLHHVLAGIGMRGCELSHNDLVYKLIAIIDLGELGLLGGDVVKMEFGREEFGGDGKSLASGSPHNGNGSQSGGCGYGTDCVWHDGVF